MVLKKGKHGIRTGNTVRAINTKYVKRYRKDACIIRRDTEVKPKGQIDDTIDLFEGSDIPCEDVPFSLNKKNRWLLPDLIKEALLQPDPTDELTTFGFDGFELVERHKLKRNKNCCSIYASHIDANEKRTLWVKTNKNNYIDADNVLKTPALHSRHTRRLYFLRDYAESDDFIDERGTAVCDLEERTKNKENISNSEERKHSVRQNPPVRYEVLYPCELSNVLTLKPKHIGNTTKKTFKCRNDIRRPWTLEGYQFRKRPQKEKRENIYDVIKEGLEEFCLEHDDDVGYISSDTPKNTSRNVGNNENQVNVRKEIVPGLPSELRISEETIKNESSKIEQERTLNIEKDKNVLQPEIFEPPQTEEALYRRKNKMDSVSVLLRKFETDIHVLERHYGEDFLECRCIPRRFVISISKYINDLDLEGIGSAYKLLRIMSKRVLAWLIFVHDPLHKLNSGNEEVYKVCLNANFNETVDEVKIEGLPEGSVLTIADIIAQSLNFLKSLPRDIMIFEPKSNARTDVRPVTVRSLLGQMKDWSACTYIPDNSYFIKHLIESVSPSVNNGDGNPSSLRGKNKTPNETLCEICYNRNRVPVALLSCSHHFCDRCWETYIHTKLDIGAGVILCPADGCKEEVDAGTVISFLDVKDVLCFARRRHNTDIEKNKLARWCSNESCGRVVMVNKLCTKTVLCICGESMCFSCSGKPHWPLPCKQYFEYIKILLETKDKNILPHEFVIKFDSKYCRICFKIVKRYAKCFTNNCPCECMLCLRCSFLWHSRELSIYRLQGENVTSLSPNDVYPSDLIPQNNIFSEARRTKWYKLAMKHRTQQHPFRLAKIQANSKLLANRIGHFILREEKKCNFIYLDFALSGSSHLRESDRVAEYMAHIVEMYKEISSIIENIAFFLNDDNESNGIHDSLHRRAMVMSTCAKTVYDLLKDGAFLNPKVVIERLNATSAEIKRVLASIVKDL